MSALVVSPLELFRTRMQSTEGINGFSGIYKMRERDNKRGIFFSTRVNELDVWQGVSNMVKREGPQALWRGLLPTMLRDVPFSGIYWMGYEKIKYRLQTHHELSHFQTSFIAGASSGMIAAIVTTPFDVVKTQRQVSSNAEDAKLGRILGNIMNKNGYAGFFRGVVPRVVKVAPACAIMISSYEMGKHFFANRKLQMEQL